MAKYNKTAKYWLQLKEDWFDDDAIKWIEEQPNGEKYSLFYLKLMLKSIKTNGYLIRQVGKILVPYEPKTLAELTRTDADTVMVAMDLFKKIGLVKILEDGAIYIEQVQEMTKTLTISAEKKQLQRAKQNEIGWTGGGQMSTIIKDKDIIKDIDIYKKDISIPSGYQMDTEIAHTPKFTPPILDEVKAYCLERKNNVDAERFVNFYASKGWMVGKNKMRDWRACVRTWERERVEKQAGERKYTSAELDGLFDNVDDLEI